MHIHADLLTYFLTETDRQTDTHTHIHTHTHTHRFWKGVWWEISFGFRTVGLRLTWGSTPRSRCHTHTTYTTHTTHTLHTPHLGWRSSTSWRGGCNIQICCLFLKIRIHTDAHTHTVSRIRCLCKCMHTLMDTHGYTSMHTCSNMVMDMVTNTHSCTMCQARAR